MTVSLSYRPSLSHRTWNPNGESGQDVTYSRSRPFHYFGIHDGTDLETLQWTRGRYDLAELSNVYTGNDARARIVLDQLRDKVVDVGGMRVLGFCVSVEHAHAERHSRSKDLKEL